MAIPVNRLNLQKGMLLIEAMIAVMIFSMGILALMGLQGAMLKNTSDNKYRVDASYIAQQRLARMWADPNNLDTYSEVDTDVSNEINGEFLPNGKRSTTVASRGFVTVKITWQSPGSVDEHNYTTSSYIGSY
jgi:type IV pilus assembly protein PilV